MDSSLTSKQNFKTVQWFDENCCFLRINNFSADIKNSEAYTHLLHQIAAPDSGVNKEALMEVSIYLSIYLSIHIYIYISKYLSFYLSF